MDHVKPQNTGSHNHFSWQQTHKASGAVLLTSVSLLPERRIIPTHLLRSQAPFLLINCDHLSKRLSFSFPPNLFLITLQNAPKPHVIQFIAFFKMFRVKRSFFGGSYLIVIFSFLFASKKLQISCF